MKVKKTLLLMCLFISSFLLAQQKTVSGIVKDSSGVLPGVSIIIKGSNTGVETDFNGQYSIKAKEGDTLVFQYLGYKTAERKVVSSNTINVTLEEAGEILDEIVITGLAGATAKTKLAVSATSVGQDLLKNVPATSAASAIQGKVAGVTVVQPSGLPGSSAIISIRGATSLLGTQEPLVIVDGVFLGSTNLSDINTEDIKSIEILKGAAAASLYGSKAANGVVQIITKRGKKNREAQVSLRSELGFTSILKDYGESKFHNFTLDGNAFALNDPNDPTSLIVDIPDGLTSLHSVIDNPFPAYYDNFGAAFGNGVFQTNSISVTGGSEKSIYYMSFQENQNQGIIKIGDLGYKRVTGKINLDVDLSDKITFSTSNTYTHVSSKEPALGSGGPLYSLQFTPPHFNLSAPNNEDGSPYNWNPFADNADGTWPTTETNPFYYLNNYKYRENRRRLISNTSLKYTMNHWLSFEATYGFDNLWYNNNEFVDKTWLDDQNSTFINGYLSNWRALTESKNSTFNIYTNNVFGDLEVKGRLQYLLEVEDYNRLSAIGTELVNEGVNNLENVLQANLNVGSSRTREIAKSYSGVLYLAYKDRYIFDGLARYEQVSSYGSLAKNQWFFRASGAYRLGLDIEAAWIDELKLRMSYGTAGLRPPLSAKYEVVNVNNGNNTKETIGNLNLGPSVSKETELGFDFNFLNRFRTSFNYSKTKNENLVIPVPLAAATGFTEQFQNAASIESTVYEATLGVDVIQKEGLNWNINAIFSKYESIITDFNRSDLQVGPSSAFILREGEVYGTFYGKSFLTSLDQLPSTEDANNYTLYKGIVVSNDGSNSPVLLKDELGNDAIVPIGNTTPDFNLSFNSTFTYKNFTLYALVDWSQGGQVYNQTKQWRFRELLHPEIDGETVGWASGVYAINAVNDFFVEDASYVKLRELSLNYNLPTKFLKNVFIKEVNMGIIGRNLFIISDYTGVDPEVTNIDGGSNGRFNDLTTFKFDAFGYPSTSTYSASITLKF